MLALVKRTEQNLNLESKAFWPDGKVSPTMNIYRTLLLEQAIAELYFCFSETEGLVLVLFVSLYPHRAMIN